MTVRVSYTSSSKDDQVIETIMLLEWHGEGLKCCEEGRTKTSITNNEKRSRISSLGLLDVVTSAQYTNQEEKRN